MSDIKKELLALKMQVNNQEESIVHQSAAMRQEVSRVKALKRAVEAEVELLRSDSEKGKIHIRVSQDQEFRAKVASAVVDEAHPGYHGNGYNYADPVEGEVYYKQTTAAWNPWHDSISWRIVLVDELMNEGNSFSSEVDWDVADIPYREMAIAYLKSEDEELEEDGDIPEWVDRSEVLNFARENNSEWAELLEAEERDALDAAISFALQEIKDEIIIEVNN
jgi:hypothetical protein